MTFTKRIPADRLRELELQIGDTLQVLDAGDSAYVFQVSRSDAPSSLEGKVSEWLKSARGSVKLESDETVDEVRMDYYASKYGFTS
jgi:hypothetical protein